MHINIDNTVIPKRESINFLGMILDDKLSWHAHANHIISKLNSSLFILSRVKHLLGTKNMVTLYYSLIYSHISYGLALWGNDP